MTTEEPQQKLDRWLKEHRGLMLRVVRSFTSNLSDQEDLLQEIAVALWKSIRQFRGESKESTWIYKVALFTATNWFRREAQRRVDAKGAETERLSGECVRSPDSRQEWLMETIRDLPLVDRTLLLSSLEGYSHEDIRQLTGLSTTNVGVRLHRLKNRLAKLATEYFDDI